LIATPNRNVLTATEKVTHIKIDASTGLGVTGNKILIEIPLGEGQRVPVLAVGQFGTVTERNVILKWTPGKFNL
jgi:hypothetical protein